MHLRMELGCLLIDAPIASLSKALLVTFLAPGAVGPTPKERIRERCVGDGSHGEVSAG